MPLASFIPIPYTVGPRATLAWLPMARLNMAAPALEDTGGDGGVPASPLSQHLGLVPLSLHSRYTYDVTYIPKQAMQYCLKIALFISYLILPCQTSIQEARLLNISTISE